MDEYGDCEKRIADLHLRLDAEHHARQKSERDLASAQAMCVEMTTKLRCESALNKQMREIMDAVTHVGPAARSGCYKFCPACRWEKMKGEMEK